MRGPTGSETLAITTQTLQNDLPLWRHSGWTVRATAGCRSTEEFVTYFTSSHTALVLLSERGHFALNGKLHCRLATVSVTRFETAPIRPFAYALAALKEEGTKNSGEEKNSS
jgi:hypothetical protein